RVHLRPSAVPIVLRFGIGVSVLCCLCGCRPRRGTAVEGYAFVAAAGNSSLAVVDLATFSVSRQIPPGAQPSPIVSGSARRSLYVRGAGGPAGLTVIDTIRLEIKKALWLADRPQRIRLAPEGGQLYVVDSRANQLQSFRLDTMRHGRQIRLPAAPVDFDV